MGAALGVKGDDELAPPFGADGSPVGDAGEGTGAGAGPDDGLGQTTAPVEPVA